MFPAFLSPVEPSQSQSRKRGVKPLLVKKLDVRVVAMLTGCSIKTPKPRPDGSVGEKWAILTLDDGKGQESDPDVGSVMMGWMFARCDEGVKLGNEWICHDEYVQHDHAEDPFDAFTKPTSNRSFMDFCKMIDVITGPEWAAKVPQDLPIYNIAGDQDPVGQYGAGVYQVSNWLTDAGCDVETLLYSGYRHEIHNYDDLKDDVEEGIIDFFGRCLFDVELEF